MSVVHLALIRISSTSPVNRVAFPLSGDQPKCTRSISFSYSISYRIFCSRSTPATDIGCDVHAQH